MVVPGVRHARAAARAPRTKGAAAAPPLIVPLLVSDAIVPEFDTPAPPTPPAASAAAVSAADRPPLLDQRLIVPAFDTPAPPMPPPLLPAHALPPFPPLIAPLLGRVVIVPAFDTPAPPAPAECRCRRFRR